jgi:cyclohexyl-isocyanide hydratase
VVVDGPFITGGGVTAGIDFALRVVAQVEGREAAEAIQLMVEYDPQPPFATGSPERAARDLVDRVRSHAGERLRERDEAVSRAVVALAHLRQ